ncbi:MAG: hypothetical protein AMS26_23680 [Bacteroides sp. SM23_62]|nr:MAG: hypothetical protein AMS26_23680 [Bacteroides sp. SM23_62]
MQYLSDYRPKLFKDMFDKNTKGEESKDLCVTCRYHSSCIYIRNGEGPVHFCEEFEVHPYRHIIGCSNPVESKEIEENPVYGGLCKNCDNRKTCMNASPDRIIWHCEEYV